MSVLTPARMNFFVGNLLAGACSLLGLIVIIGWMLDIRVLIQLNPAFVPMQFNTALGLFLTGIACNAWMSGFNKLKTLCALIVLPLGVVTLSQDAFGLNVGLDQLFFDHHVTTQTAHPGRMAPNTAVCFILSSLIFLSAPGRRPEARQLHRSIILTTVLLALSLLAMMGYILNIEQTYGWGRYTRMAAHTSFGFLLITSAVFTQTLVRYFHRVSANLITSQVALFGTLVTLLLWSAFDGREKQIAKETTQKELVYFVDGVKQQMQEVMQAINLFSSTQPYLTQYLRERLSDDIEAEVRQFPGLVGMAALSQDEMLTWFYPSKWQYVFNDQFTRVNTSGLSKGMILGQIYFDQSGNRLSLIIDTESQSENIDAIVAIVDLKQFMGSSLTDFSARGVHFQVTETISDTALIARKPEFELAEPIDTLTVNLGAQTWQIQAFLDETSTIQQHHSLPVVFLIFGVVLTIIMTALTHFLLKNREVTEMLRQLVDEHQQALRDTHETEKLLSIASEVSGFGAFSWNLQTGTVAWNDYMFTLYGIENNEKDRKLTYENWFNALVEEERDETASNLQSAIKNKLPWHAKFRIKTPDGDIKHIAAAATYMFDDTGEIVKVVGGNMDITEQIENEKRLEDLRALAEQSNIAKSQFLANMSHEIRTPMNGVLGISELLGRTELNSVQREYLNLITKSAGSLLNILNEILDHSKIEAGLLELNNVTVSLDNHIGDIVKSFAPNAHGKKLSIQHYIQPGTPDCIVTDPTRLRQVVYNLVGNAVKFTESGRVFVKVWGKNATGKNVGDAFTLMISVEDTGIGIPENKLSSIFEAFTQADASMTRKFGGTGLGLPITRKLCNMMGGDVRVQSIEGLGSTFTVEVSVSIGDHNALPADESNAYLLRQVDFSGLRCLCLDDNDINLRWLRDMVESWGGQAFTAADVDTAVSIIARQERASQPIEVALVDLNMPVKSGIDFLNELKDFKLEKPEIVVMLSSTENEKSFKELEKLGVHYFLMKPVKQSEVYNAIHRLLDDTNSHTSDKHVSLPGEKLSAPLKILVAEDNPVNARLVKDILKMRGHQCTIVGDGKDALEQIKQARYNVVLMDVQMPVMDGLEATQAIRKFEQMHDLQPVPIVGLTAHALAGDRETCISAGMDDYLTKPVNSHQMLDTIERLGNSAKHEASQPNGLPTKVSEAQKPYCGNVTWFDRDRGLRSCGNSHETLLEVAKLAITIMPEELKEIDALLLQNNVDETCNKLHRLRGMIGNFAAQTLTNELLSLENEIKSTGDIHVGRWASISIKLVCLIEEAEQYVSSQENPNE